ncbi:FAD-dependent oxidoreductase [Diaphorobacter sp. C33]|uniref:D-arginine dehydrogenase n=3 Tax=Diaphorobacter TaxID=238749 RepID=A0AAX1WSG5_9BURK|nr:MULTISPECIES: FAD-dependent oxidoreductase [unclassified Diaphorobacter]POR09217.1 FAD-dependent oxidoreductase [Diaphorobacter sp. LR2014-1]PZU36097.1 MAG: FAD-binding oxidoreductase [Acidovorax sp.]ROR41325.1 D-arginine dehydrogenase [Diaphorobacter nitroreducens]WKK90401.1 FAD-dependent oxidoreductase [Diaphorobacter sp. C33]
MQPYDFVIIGAGIAGASAGWELAAHRRVLLLEREAQPGYHTTGRSAALYSATYGTPNICALTRASRAFYDAPPPEFGSAPILTPRGVVYLAGPDQLDLLEAAYAEALPRNPQVRRLTREELLEQAPCLRPEAVAAGMSEPGAADIDVHALHQGYLRGLRQRGGEIRTHAEVTALQRGEEGWHITLADGEVLHARAVVNAAGAWADVVAAQAGVPPIGLEPRRRTAFTFPVPAGMQAAHWPAVIGIAEDYYFKPDAGQMLGSPANADAVAPHDVVPEELDVALGIHRIEQVTCFQIRRPSHTWAGLRSFVADGDLVIGWDNHVPGFFWLAAQGGYGIQSAAGAALLTRQLALGEPLAPELAREGVDVAGLSPARLR